MLGGERAPAPGLGVYDDVLRGGSERDGVISVNTTSWVFFSIFTVNDDHISMPKAFDLKF